MKNILKSLLPIAVIALGLTPAVAFPDVDSNHWAAPQINLLSEQGVIVQTAQPTSGVYPGRPQPSLLGKTLLLGALPWPQGIVQGLYSSLG